ncbi:MAG: Hpt domain-containing protein [Pseudobdellovibrio sp.]
MLFGEFLLSKKLVTSGQLLEAIAYQLEMTPPLLRVCLEAKVFSEEQLVHIIVEQIQGQKELLEVIRSKNILKESQIEFLLKKQSEARPNLGNILVQKSILKLSDITDNLNQFLEIKNQKSKLDEVSKELQSEPNSIENEIPNFNFSELDSEMLHEYLEIFDVTKRQDLETVILSWTKDANVEQMREFYRDLHTLKGTSRFLKAFMTEHIVHCLENVVTEAIRSADQLKDDVEILASLEEMFLQGLDILWKIRCSIEDDLTEENYWNKSELRQQILGLIIKSSDQQKKLIDLQSNIDLDKFKDRF